jgi:MFS family permease
METRHVPAPAQAISNLSTAYNLVVINIAHVIIAYQYCGGADGCTAQVETAATASLVGAILGQLTFGYVGDCIGRGPALQITMGLSILGALVSAFAVPFGDDQPSVLDFLAMSRFVLGLGVGGVYPLSATIATESSSDGSRGRNASIVFSMQGVAYLSSPLIAWFLLSTVGVPPTGSGNKDPGLAWRLMLGCGALPGIGLLPFKSAQARKAATKPPFPVSDDMDIPMNPVALDSAAAPADDDLPPVEPRTPVPPPVVRKVTLVGALRQRKYWGKLLGTAGGWFLFDITFYGNALFQPTVSGGLGEAGMLAGARAGWVLGRVKVADGERVGPWWWWWWWEGREVLGCGGYRDVVADPHPHPLTRAAPPPGISLSSPFRYCVPSLKVFTSPPTFRYCLPSSTWTRLPPVKALPSRATLRTTCARRWRWWLQSGCRVSMGPRHTYTRTSPHTRISTGAVAHAHLSLHTWVSMNS